MKAKGSHVAWQGSSWRLRVETLSLPDGSSFERGAIQHPGAVVLIPTIEVQGKPVILMLQQYRFAIDETILELPAGTREWDEDWLECAQRELREETGYRAGKFTSLGQLWPAPGLSDELMHLYLAEDLTPDPLPADVDEQMDLQPLPLDTLVAMAQDGRLQDAKSIIGVLRTAMFLGH